MTTAMMILWKLSIAGKERRRVSKVHPPSSKSCAPADIDINIVFNINIVFDIVIIGEGNPRHQISNVHSKSFRF